MQIMGATFWGVVSSACHFVWLDTNRSDKEAGVHLLFKSYSLSLALFSVQQPEWKKERDYQIIIL